METITITLRNGRTSTQAFEDAALVEGWESTVEKVMTGTTTVANADYTGDAQATVEEALGVTTGIAIKQLEDDGTNTTITYEQTTKVPNPVTAAQMGAQIWGKKIDALDLETQSKAVAIREKQSVAGGNVTTVA